MERSRATRPSLVPGITLWQGHWRIRTLGPYRLVITFPSFTQFSIDTSAILDIPPPLRGFPPPIREAHLSNVYVCYPLPVFSKFASAITHASFIWPLPRFRLDLGARIYPPFTEDVHQELFCIGGKFFLPSFPFSFRVYWSWMLTCTLWCSLVCKSMTRRLVHPLYLGRRCIRDSTSRRLVFFPSHSPIPPSLKKP